jgi:hypothetical protein
MLPRFLASFTVAPALAVLVAVSPAAAAGQTQASPSKTAPAIKTTSAKGAGAATARKFVPKRLPWGDPDISGNFSTKNEMNTPMERPAEFAGRRIEDVTAAELAKANEVRRREALAAAPYPGGGSRARGVAIAVPVHWLDNLDTDNSRPWLVVDPPDGKIPPLTEQAKQRAAAAVEARRGRGTADSFTDRSWSDRCISFGAPTFAAGLYGASYQILQSKDYVAIRYEMIHETRLIPIEGRGAARPHNNSALSTFEGDAVGHWEGDTLVVDTKNFNGRINSFSAYRASGTTLHLIERFTRTAPNKVEVMTTIDDPATWTRPWSWSVPLTEDDGQPVFEYACHEGNYGLRNILSAGRSDDKKGIKSSDSVDSQDDLKGDFDQ